MNINKYITSGIIETYVLGLASPEEASQFERLLPYYPELQSAVSDFGFQLELFSIQNEVPPPTGLYEKIYDKVSDVPAVVPPPAKRGRSSEGASGADYLYVKETSNHIRVHKHWRVAFICIFLLSKLLLFGFIYYLLQYRHAEHSLRVMEQQQQQKVNKAQLSPDAQEEDK